MAPGRAALAPTKKHKQTNTHTHARTCTQKKQTHTHTHTHSLTVWTGHERLISLTCEVLPSDPKASTGCHSLHQLALPGGKDTEPDPKIEQEDRFQTRFKPLEIPEAGTLHHPCWCPQQKSQMSPSGRSQCRAGCPATPATMSDRSCRFTLGQLRRSNRQSNHLTSHSVSIDIL